MSLYCGECSGGPMWTMRAAQRPSWHRHPPPQSIVAERHSIVHIMSVHDGAFARATHADG